MKLFVSLALSSFALISGVESSYAACNQSQLVGTWTLATTQTFCTIRIDAKGKADGPCIFYTTPGNDTDFTTSTKTFKAVLDGNCRFNGRFGTRTKIDGNALFRGGAATISGGFEGYGQFTMYR